MRVKQLSLAETFSYDFTSQLATGETLSTIAGAVVTPSTGVTVTQSALAGNEHRLSLTGGKVDRYYRVSLSITTSTARTLNTEYWFKVIPDGAQQNMLTYLDIWVEFRDQVDDSYNAEESDADLLWKNREVVRYWNAIMREFCTRRPIVDKHTAALCNLAVVADTATCSFDSRILFISDVRLASDNRPLEKVPDNAIGSRPYTLFDSTNTGTPRWYQEDEYAITLAPVPSADDTLQLQVGRLPLEVATWDLRNTYFVEVPIEHKDALIEGMKSLAYLKRDSDANAPQLAALADQMFSAKVGPKRTAEQIRRRRRTTNLQQTASASPFASNPYFF